MKSEKLSQGISPLRRGGWWQILMFWAMIEAFRTLLALVFSAA